MNYKKLSLAFYISIIVFLSFSSFVFSQNEENTTKVMMITPYGVIKIKLYNQTPLHRDNFIKLVEQHYYDSLLFHRVIKNFMIQGGDPDSKDAKQGIELGNGGPDYTIPAEFNKELFHKKGVLAAARESDFQNPSQASSGSQFYIVQGKIFTDSLLQIQANRITKSKLFNKIINREENKTYLAKYKEYTTAQKLDSVKYIYEIIDKMVAQELPTVTPHEFTEEQKKIYTTIGGTPHLDGSYTIFGEVYEGMEVVEKIAEQKTDARNRPLTNIRMKISIIK